MTHRLLVNPGTPQAWEIQLKSGQNRLGRGEQNDFKVNHPSVSGSHCEIVVSSAGVLLKDLGSTNGTFVNRAPVHEALLQTGQHLHLGGVEMLFEATGPAGDPSPVTAPVAAPVTARITLPRPAPSGLRISKPPAEEPAPAVVESPPLAPPFPHLRVSEFLKSSGEDAKLEAVTLEQNKAVAQKYLKPAALVIAVVKPDEVKSNLRDSGGEGNSKPE
jgi:pSer/pThr/pTyr-binding forkhead associated (FHA) protein